MVCERLQYLRHSPRQWVLTGGVASCSLTRRDVEGASAHTAHVKSGTGVQPSRRGLERRFLGITARAVSQVDVEWRLCHGEKWAFARWSVKSRTDCFWKKDVGPRPTAARWPDREVMSRQRIRAAIRFERSHGRECFIGASRGRLEAAFAGAALSAHPGFGEEAVEGFVQRVLTKG